MSNLEELERLLEAATPLPWAWHQTRNGRVYVQDEDTYALASMMKRTSHPSMAGEPVPNAALIVAAVNSLPALIASARRAEALSDVNRLASIIREVDGDHSLGAGALAEAIVARATLAGEGAPR